MGLDADKNSLQKEIEELEGEIEEIEKIILPIRYDMRLFSYWKKKRRNSREKKISFDQ